MDTKKLMIIVLVVVVLIFVITLGVGGCQGSEKPDPSDAGAVGALKGLRGNRFLVIGDKTSTTCAVIDFQRIRVSGSCEINFQKRAFFRRATRVVFQPNASVRVVIEPENGPGLDEIADPFKCFASAVDHAGGKIRLSGNATIFLIQKREEMPARGCRD